jgi:hypothetical protein
MSIVQGIIADYYKLKCQNEVFDVHLNLLKTECKFLQSKAFKARTRSERLEIKKYIFKIKYFKYIIKEFQLQQRNLSIVEQYVTFFLI